MNRIENGRFSYMPAITRDTSLGPFTIFLQHVRLSYVTCKFTSRVQT